MGKQLKLKRGYDIRMAGTADKSIQDLPVSDVIAIKPPDFRKVKPKLLVEAGESVKAGQALFIDKLRPTLSFTSPVSGEIADIILGPKRTILEVRILPDKAAMEFVPFATGDPAGMSREQIVRQLLESGCWNYIHQRPYSIIANPTEQPKAIFISMFDSAPLAPDLMFIIDQDRAHFETGLKVMQQLANGNLHICLRQSASAPGNGTTFGLPLTHVHYVNGPHPAGNVGVQIHHIDPIRKDQVVWYIHPQDVIIIGRLFNEGRYHPTRIVALTGAVAHPKYFRVITGQLLSSMTDHPGNGQAMRIVQGNVLHGAKSSPDDFLSFYTNHITILAEGDQPEFFGWLLPGFKKLSLSRTYFSWLAPKRQYVPDTNLHGEERAFVMTGEYDRVLPMDILPVYLLKAILAKDIEQMEELGIYEVAEEDFALCEFVCTSKINVQQIIREGLDMMMEEN